MVRGRLWESSFPSTSLEARSLVLGCCGVLQDSTRDLLSVFLSLRGTDISGARHCLQLLMWVWGLSLGVSGLQGRRLTFEHLPSSLPSLLSVNFCLLLCVYLSYMSHTYMINIIYHRYMMHVYIFTGQGTTSWTSLLPPLWVLGIKLSL